MTGGDKFAEVVSPRRYDYSVLVGSSNNSSSDGNTDHENVACANDLCKERFLWDYSTSLCLPFTSFFNGNFCKFPFMSMRFSNLLAGTSVIIF